MTSNNEGNTDLQRARAKYQEERDKRLTPSRGKLLDLSDRQELLADALAAVLAHAKRLPETRQAEPGAGGRTSGWTRWSGGSSASSATAVSARLSPAGHAPSA
jgi:hypothetical protein